MGENKVFHVTFFDKPAGDYTSKEFLNLIDKEELIKKGIKIDALITYK